MRGLLSEHSSPDSEQLCLHNSTMEDSMIDTAMIADVSQTNRANHDDNHPDYAKKRTLITGKIPGNGLKHRACYNALSSR